MRVAALPMAALSRRLPSVRHFHLVVSPIQFVCCWWGVLVLQLLCATFLLVVGFVHIYIAREAVYHNIWLLRVPQSMLRVAGVSFVVVALPHFLAIAQDIRHSIASRRLTFSCEARRPPRPTTRSLLVPPTELLSEMAPPVPWRLVQIKDAVATYWRRYFDASGEYFELGFCLRQCVEIVAQTYQAYLFSWSVPVVQLNHVLVVLLVVNCVYSPALTRLLHHKPGFHRAAVVGVDLVIDIAVSVVIPLAILLPHMVEFDWATSKYPDELRFDDVWFTQTLSEVRQVMVTSPLDFVSSLVPHIASIDSLSSLKTVLLRVKNESSDPSMEAVDSTRKHSIFTASSSKSWFIRMVDRGTILWAFGVVIAQIQAEIRPANTHTTVCVLPMTPWFARNMSCAFVGLNCHRQGIRGSRAEITSLLNIVDRESLMKLHINHCPQLEMPPIIAEFSYLQGVQTLNCTISAWPLSAALSQSKHSKMAEVYLYNTNLTEFPRGLFHGDLPTRLSFVLHRSNLTRLPDDFGDASMGHRWPNFFLEHVPLVSLPESFKRASVGSLTLFDTQIKTIPEDLFHSQTFARLRLSGNRLLSKLPSQVGSLSSLAILYAEHTNVSELPPWFDEWYSAKLDAVDRKKDTVFASFYGSPICAQRSAMDSVEGLCESVSSVESEDHRFNVVQSLRPV